MTLLLFATSRGPTLFFAQALLSANSPPNTNQSPKMTTIGEAYMFGRRAAFRTYETPDHTEALMEYGEFRSEEEAKLGIKLSLKEHKVIRNEHIKDLHGHLIGERIVAAPKQEKKAFMVIRKHDLNYWITQSVSLAVAVQVDRLIEPPPPQPAMAEDKKSPSPCDRSVEFLSKQQKLFEQERKHVGQSQVQGRVAIIVNSDGHVVGARVIQTSSGDAIDRLLSQARSMKFKPRPGCGTSDATMSFTIQRH